MGLKAGAKMHAVDPRRTASAKFADAWLGLDVGTDIALANAVAREIIASDLHNKDFIAHSTNGFEDFAAHVDSYTLEKASSITLLLNALLHRVLTIGTPLSCRSFK